MCWYEIVKRSVEGVNLVGLLCYLYNVLEEDVVGMVVKLNEMIKVLIGSFVIGMDGGDIL